MRRVLPLLGVIGAAILFAGACAKSPTSPGMGTVRVSLTDAPADFDSVLLVIRRVDVHLANASDSDGWSSFVPAVQRLDLLRLQNGVFAALGSVLTPAGHYTQVRLILDPGSYVVVDGVPHPLTVPSGMQTGLKLIGEFDVPAGGLVDLGIDLNAARGLHLTGAGQYMLKPTARIMVLNVAGAIAGVVAPADTASAVYAIAGADTVAGTISAPDGHFMLGMLPGGTYNVAVDAPVSLRDTTLTGVAVSAGAVTNVGTITLSPK